MFDRDPPDIPPYELFNVNSIVLGTFLGGPLAGGILMAVNYGRLGRPRPQRLAVLVGLVAMVALFFLIPNPSVESTSGWFFIVLAAAYWTSHSLQGSALAKHRGRRGKVASAWRAAGVGALCSLVLGAGFAASMDIQRTVKLGRRVETEDDFHIYRSGEATEEDARFLVDFCKEAEMPSLTAGLGASGGEYTLSIVTNEGRGSQEAVDAFKDWGGRLADRRFGRPLTVNLLDEQYRVRKSIRVE